MDQRFEVVSGCFSRDPHCNLETAIEYGVPADRTYDTLERLLAGERGRIDAIVILTPTDQHAPQVVRCLSEGLPVICEKALVANLDEAKSVAAAVEATRGFLAVTYNYTGYPMLRELRQMVDDGRLGRIRQVQIEMPQEGFARLDRQGNPIRPQGWRLKDGQVPTISLDLGIHLHSLVSFLTGEHPLEVVAEAATHGNFKDVVDNVNCIARFSQDIHCGIWYSKTALGYRNGLKVRLFGDEGGVEWLQEDPEHLIYGDRQGRRMVIDRATGDVSVANQARYTRFKAGHPAGFVEAFANYYHDIADGLDAFLDGRPFAPTGYLMGIETALAGTAMLQAIAESARQRAWTAVR